MRQFKSLCIFMLLSVSKVISQELSYDNFPEIIKGIKFNASSIDVLSHILETKAHLVDLKTFGNGTCETYEKGVFEGYKMSHKLDYEEFCSNYQGKLFSYKVSLHIPKDSTDKHIQLMGQFSKMLTERFGARSVSITFDADTTQVEQILEFQKLSDPFNAKSLSLLWHAFKDEDMLEYRSCSLELRSGGPVRIITFWCNEVDTF